MNFACAAVWVQSAVIYPKGRDLAAIVCALAEQAERSQLIKDQRVRLGPLQKTTVKIKS